MRQAVSIVEGVPFELSLPFYFAGSSFSGNSSFERFLIQPGMREMMTNTTAPIPRYMKVFPRSPSPLTMAPPMKVKAIAPGSMQIHETRTYVGNPIFVSP